MKAMKARKGGYTLLFVAVLGMLFGAATNVSALSIYVLGSSGTPPPISHLTNLGHTVTNGGTLANYTGFDQVWDLRYNMNLNAADITAMGNYLQQGGRMYLSGESDSFDGSRNNSLTSWISGVGGGSVTLAGSLGLNNQAITTQGQIVNSPNIFPSVQFNFGRTVSSTQGFLVTETSGGGPGSLVGWNFGDIAESSSARMLVGFDLDFFVDNGQNWTENMVTYLGAAAPKPVPEPSTLLLLGTGLVGLIGYGMRRKRRA